MSDANINPATSQADAPQSLRTRLLMGALLAAFLGGAAGLWWRFGEAVYISSMMGAIIACF